MNITREKKIERVEELKQKFEKFPTFYLLDFNKLTVTQASDLRRRLREKNFAFQVIKNRLAVRALKTDYYEHLKDYFRGPTAVAFAAEDPVGLAKILKEYAKETKLLRFKAGILEGLYLEAERFEEIANLGSRQELLAKLGYLMAYPLIKFYQTWQAPLVNFGQLLSQLKSKK